MARLKKQVTRCFAKIKGREARLEMLVIINFAIFILGIKLKVYIF